MRLSITVASILAALVGTSCAPEKPEIVARNPSGDQTQVAVVVGDESFTLEQVTRRLDVMPDWARARFATVERKKSFLATTVQFELLHDEAQKLGYDRHPDTIHQLESRLVEAWLDEQVEKDPISPEQLRDHFEANIDQFRRGEARKTYIVATATKDRAAELRQRILAESNRFDAFKKVARTFSLHFPSAGAGGLIGAVTARSVAPIDDTPVTYETGEDNAILDLVWKLEEGEVSKPIEMADEWLLVVWSGELPAENVTFDEVSADVRSHLLKQRRNELVESYQQ